MSEADAKPKVEIPDVSVNLSYYVNAYIAVRDKKAALKKRHEEELAPYNDALNALDIGFLNHFQKTNSDNATIKGVGNVYRSERKSARIVDQASFRRHIIGSEAWELLDLKANAPAVKAAIDAAGHDIPGVEYSETATIGVRKS